MERLKDTIRKSRQIWLGHVHQIQKDVLQGKTLIGYQKKEKRLREWITWTQISMLTPDLSDMEELCCYI